MTTTRRLHHQAGFSARLHLDDHGKMAIAIVLGFGLLVATAVLATRLTDSQSESDQTFAGMSMSPPPTLPALTLQRSDGAKWTTEETSGRFSMFFFGYTNCPDVCPLTLSRAKQIHNQLGVEAAKIDFYFVTVDPERDTPERLGNYVSQFNPSFTGLTGTPGQLETAQAAFGVVAEKQAGGSGAGYSVDHTATSYLVDDQGRIVLLYAHDAPAEDAIGDIRALLGGENP